MEMGLLIWPFKLWSIIAWWTQYFTACVNKVKATASKPLKNGHMGDEHFVRLSLVRRYIEMYGQYIGRGNFVSRKRAAPGGGDSNP